MTVSFGTVVTIVAHTPIWVWPLYVLLLILGFQRTRDSVVPLWRVLILPAVVIVLGVIGAFGAGSGGVPAILAGTAIGVAFGWWLEPRDSARRVAGGALWLRGEWWTLAQIVLILVFRYAANVVTAMDPVLAANPIWHSGVLFFSALLSGLFLGRTAKRLTATAAESDTVHHPRAASSTPAP